MSVPPGRRSHRRRKSDHSSTYSSVYISLKVKNWTRVHKDSVGNTKVYPKRRESPEVHYKVNIVSNHLNVSFIKLFFFRSRSHWESQDEDTSIKDTDRPFFFLEIEPTLRLDLAHFTWRVQDTRNFITRHLLRLHPVATPLMVSKYFLKVPICLNLFDLTGSLQLRGDPKT